MIRLVLPMPPSLNHADRNGSGRRFKSPEAKAFLIEAAALVRKARGPENTQFCEPVRVFFRAAQPRANADLDNRAKLLGDSLEAGGLVVNDKLIHAWDMAWDARVPKGVAHVAIQTLEPLPVAGRQARGRGRAATRPAPNHSPARTGADGS